MIRHLLCCFLALLLVIALPVKADDALLQQLIPSSKPQFLPVGQAFVVRVQQTQNQLQVTLQPADGYYLYRDKISLTINGKAQPISLPAGELHHDEFLGQTEIYRQVVTFAVHLPTIEANTKATLHYQGCTPGLCYPPQQQSFALSAYQPTATPLPTAPPLAAPSQQIGLLTLLGFFALGVGLSLTPCVYPMYPVLSAMLSQHGNRLNWQHGFRLSLVYVLGMALTYTLLGVLIAAVGAGIQGWLQNPWLLSLFSIFYLTLAIGLFIGNGLQLPRVWQEKLNALANRQSLHSWQGVTLLGALSGLIGSPCTSAPLAGALLFIAQHGKPWFGASALFLLSLGMGVPLLMLGSLGGKYLPKAGRWMLYIKQLFALMLLAMPLFLLERFIPVYIAAQLWRWFIIGLIVWSIWQLWPAHRSPKIKQITLLLILFTGIAGPGQYGWKSESTLPFVSIKNSAELHQQLTTAKAQGKPVMLDLYAEWCTACRELDQKTFSDPQIKKLLEQYQLIRADVTANTAEDRALMQELQVLGLPNVLFFDAQGQINQSLRIEGYVSARELETMLTSCQSKQTC